MGGWSREPFGSWCSKGRRQLAGGSILTAPLALQRGCGYNSILPFKKKKKTPTKQNLKKEKRLALKLWADFTSI